MRSILVRVLAPATLLLVSVTVAVVLAEGVARLVVNPADFLQATPLEDEILGLRIAPFTTGHDALGFRNRRMPERADIVAIGDSMTYGVSAPREESWPQQLGRLTGREVYNMGLGGFGPLQYVYLARELAPRLKPRLVVVGFYFGNDLMDAYYMAHRPFWNDWRVSTDGAAALTAFDQAGQAEPKKRFETLRNWLSRNCVLYSMARESFLRSFAAREQDELSRRSTPDVRLPWSDAAAPAVRTTFTPQVRLAAVDASIPAVRDGLAISLRAFAELKAELGRQERALLVVLIPTKELAYCRYLRQTGVALPATYSALCEAEVRTKLKLVHFLSEQGINYLDATPALEAQIARHAQLYPADSDGHPQGAGYGVIAQTIAGILRDVPAGAPAKP
jgi:lysophospholipase L1-like esterase